MKGLGVWALLAATAATLLAIPVFERWLIRQPSCLAFIGMAPVNYDGAKNLTDADLKSLAAQMRAIRDAALKQEVVHRLTGTNILITRRLSTYTSVLSAAPTPAGWVVQEAAQPFDAEARPMPFAAAAPRLLSADAGRKLDALLAKTCASSEPYFVPFRPDVWLGFDLTHEYPNPQYWLIDVDDGANSFSVLRYHPDGVTGRMAALIIEGGQGFLEGDGSASVDWHAHPKSGLP